MLPGLILARAGGELHAVQRDDAFGREAQLVGGAARRARAQLELGGIEICATGCGIVAVGPGDVHERVDVLQIAVDLDRRVVRPCTPRRWRELPGRPGARSTLPLRLASPVRVSSFGCPSAIEIEARPCRPGRNRSSGPESRSRRGRGPLRGAGRGLRCARAPSPRPGRRPRGGRINGTAVANKA